MISRPQNRNDYDQLIFKTCKLLDISDKSIYDISNLPKIEINRFIGIINYISSALNVLKCFFWKLKNNELLFIIKEIAYLKNTIYFLQSQKISKSINYFIAFNSSVQPDAVICEILKEKGVKTYSMQHAVYSNQIIKTEEVINYENITAEYFLAWNMYTKRLIEENSEFSVDKIIICGSPLFKGLNKKKINKEFTKCLILLPRYYYEKESLRLLKDIGKIKSNNIQFSIKLHPTAKKSKIMDLCSKMNLKIVSNETTLQEVLENNSFNFFMSFNTSSYYQCLMNGKHCLRLTYLENDIFHGIDEDKVEDIDNLEIVINHLKNLNQNETYEKFDNTLKTYFSINKVNYIKILSE